MLGNQSRKSITLNSNHLLYSRKSTLYRILFMVEWLSKFILFSVALGTLFFYQIKTIFKMSLFKTFKSLKNILR